MNKEENITPEPQDVQKEQLESLSNEEELTSDSRKKLLASMIDEDDEKIDNRDSLQALLKEISIDGEWFKNQIGVFALILLGVILYITNRYQAQKEMIEEEKLRTELTDWKYRNMTRKSQLTMRTRQSQLEFQLKALGDSTLKVSKIPPYILSVEK